MSPPPPAGAHPEAVVLHAAPRDVEGRIDLDLLADWLQPCDVLESAIAGWSYVVPHGGAVVTDDGCVTRLHHRGGQVEELGSDPFRAVDDLGVRLGLDPSSVPDPALPPFTGGLIGAFAYELGHRVERVERRAGGHPRAHLSLRHADVVVALDPSREQAIGVARPSPLVTTAPAGRLASLQDRLTALAAAPPLRRTPPPTRPQVVATSLTHAEHLAVVRRALEAIGAGEVFQVNLSQRLRARFEGDVVDLYRALRRHSPAPYGAVLPDLGLASISPEGFLEVEAGRVEARPIKGTRRRATEPALDAALADDLATSTKDRAENIMIVDLVRNDLGRVCRTGSIQVEELAQVESHPTVWHLVSRIHGDLHDDVGYGALLRATFPCGSITGAPKVAAMQHIERLEPVGRGWYCGAVGYLSAGSARLSVAIRTATLHPDGSADYGAGGGIVADSDPDGEHVETLDKAAAFLRAVTAVRVAGGRLLPDGPGARPTTVGRPVGR